MLLARAGMAALVVTGLLTFTLLTARVSSAAQTADITHSERRQGDGCPAQPTTVGVEFPDVLPAYTCFALPVSASGTIKSESVVTVSLNPTLTGDLDLHLREPSGALAPTLMQRPGRTTIGSGDSSNLKDTALIRFGDVPFDSEALGMSLSGFGFVCADDGECAFRPNRDQERSSIESFGDFAGVDAAGEWQFCVRGNAGAIDSVTLDPACVAVPTAVTLTTFRAGPPPQPLLPTVAAATAGALLNLGALWMRRRMTV